MNSSLIQADINKSSLPPPSCSQPSCSIVPQADPLGPRTGYNLFKDHSKKNLVDETTSQHGRKVSHWKNYKCVPKSGGNNCQQCGRVLCVAAHRRVSDLPRIRSSSGSNMSRAHKGAARGKKWY